MTTTTALEPAPLVSQVMHHSTARATERLILLVLASFQGDGDSCWPSIGTLARLAHTQERNVQICLRKLIDRGELHVDVRGGPLGRGREGTQPNRYRVLVRCPDSCSGGPAHVDLAPA